MKTILILALSFVIINSFGQMDNAYWVIEQNVSRKDLTTIRFYSKDHLLLQESLIEGRVIDISRRKDKRMLNQLLTNYLNREYSISKKPKSKRPV